MAAKYSDDPMVARSSDRAQLTKSHLDWLERPKQKPNQSGPVMYSCFPTIDLDKTRMIDIHGIVSAEMDRMHVGKFLLCRSILPAIRASALQLIVDDPRGEKCLRVSLCDFDRSIRPGAVLAIMHPWFMRSTDGLAEIRVANMEHVHLFGENDEFLKDIVWKAPLPELSGIVDNTEKKSSRVSSKKSDQHATSNISSEKPDEAPSTKDQNQAPTSTKKDDQSADVKKKMEVPPLSKEHEAMIAKEEKGEYDLVAMIEESKTTKYLDMHADYYASEFYDRKEIAGKGRGYVAKKTIPAGTLLMACQAYKMYELDEDADFINGPALSDDPRKFNKQISMCEEFRELNNNVKIGPDTCTCKVEKQRRRVISYINDVFGVGGVRFFLEHYAGIWIRPAYFNHTCFQANCFRFRIGDFQFVRTNREIKRGEELLVEYFSPRMPYESRKHILEHQFDFECNCELCRLESSMSASIGRRMEEIVTILDEMRQRHESNGGLKQNDVDALRKLLPEVRSFLPKKNKKENFLAQRIQKALAIGIINNAKNYPTIKWKMDANELILDLYKMAIESNDVYMAFLHAKLLVDMADGRMKMFEKEKQTKMVSDEEENVKKWTTEARKLARILFGDESMADQIRVGGMKTK